VIIGNVLLMSIEYYEMPQSVSDILKLANLSFTGVFIGEAALKVVGLGWKGYWESWWNRFDLFIVVISCAEIALDLVLGASQFNPTLLRVLRIFRATRLIRLLNASLGLQALLQTMTVALPKVLNVVVVMILLFYIYACAAVEMFGKAGCDLSPCEGLSRHSTFKNWPYAMLTLYRLMTGDNGFGLMRDMLREAPRCDESIDCTHDCCTQGGSFTAILFFVSFSVLSKLVLLNVIIAILMTQLADANEEVLLEAIASQSERIMEMEGEELSRKLGLEEEDDPHEMQSSIMKEKHRREREEKNGKAQQQGWVHKAPGVVNTETAPVVVSTDP